MLYASAANARSSRRRLANAAKARIESGAGLGFIFRRLTFDLSGWPQASPLEGMVRSHCWLSEGRGASS
jgi:hypothetical protein